LLLTEDNSLRQGSSCCLTKLSSLTQVRCFLLMMMVNALESGRLLPSNMSTCPQLWATQLLSVWETAPEADCCAPFRIVLVNSSGKLRAHSELFLYQSTRKNGLKVRMIALLWRSQFFFAFRRERFAAVNGRFSVMGNRSQMAQTIIFSLTRKERNGRWRRFPGSRLAPAEKVSKRSTPCFRLRWTRPDHFHTLRTCTLKRWNNVQFRSRNETVFALEASFMQESRERMRKWVKPYQTAGSFARISPLFSARKCMRARQCAVNLQPLNTMNPSRSGSSSGQWLYCSWLRATA